MIVFEQIPEETKNPSKMINTGANKIDFFILFLNLKSNDVEALNS
jgi:hypothetical protein